MSQGKNKKRRRKRSGPTSKVAIAALGGFAIVTAVLLVAALNINRAPASTYTSPARSITTPSQQPAAPLSETVVLIGDSYSAGAGASSRAASWVAVTSAAKGWKLTNLSHGGTGYLATATANAKLACGLAYCPNYQEVIATAAATKPRTVIIAGGRNDSGGGADAVARAVKTFYANLRTSLPDSKIVALNPLWGSGTPPASLDALAAVVKESVEGVGGQYIDIGQPLFGQPQLMSSDGVHPNDAGHAAIAKAFMALIPSAGM